MLFFHAYLNIGGEQYKNCTIYTNRLPSGNDYTVAVDEYFKSKFCGRDLKEFCDDFKPNQGDEIYLVPDSVYAVQDVRNNYKLKRGFNTGVCNVFSPFPVKGKQFTIRYHHTYYDKASNIVCLIWDPHTRANRPDRTKVAEGMSQLCGFHISPSEVNIDCDKVVTFYRVNDSYQKLLSGDHEKPCIYYEDLLMKRNELTVDQLCMLFESSKGSISTKGIENYVLQLSAISQTNWKDYPDTMSTLMHDLLRWRYLHSHIVDTISAYPKQVREIINYQYPKYNEFSDSKDREMMRGVLEHILDIKDCRFATFKQLQDKLSYNGIYNSLFNRFYNTMIKITPKRNEE